MTAKSPAGCCPGDHPRLPRRGVLQLGGVGLLGLGMADLLRLRAEGAELLTVAARRRPCTGLYHPLYRLCTGSVPALYHICTGFVAPLYMI